MYYQSEHSDSLFHDGLTNGVGGGTKRHSGRYPWGSGKNPYQHEEGYPFKTSGDFLSRVEELEAQGKTPAQIADELKIPHKKYKVYRSVAVAERRAGMIADVMQMYEQGISKSEIGRRMGLNESTIRHFLKVGMEAKERPVEPVKDFLKKRLEEVSMIDVGAASEKYINNGISASKLDAAVTELEAEGYPVHTRRFMQTTHPDADTRTTVKILCRPGTTQQDVYNHPEEIEGVVDFCEDANGKIRGFQYPNSLDSKRLAIVYAEDGGKDRDGLIELRRGAKDLSLGDAHYAQVRIMVDGTHYLKGMACYSDDLPEGVDVRFNTNKSKEIPVFGKGDETVLKPIKGDPKNPFGSYVPASGQYEYDGPNGEKILSPINKTREEGEWEKWSKTLPSQFLAKQREELVAKQLNLTIAEKEDEYEAIKKITNPTLKRQLLKDFADDCDATAVNLDAAPLPGQAYHVIMPIPSLKDNEVYAPNYPDGSTLALVRFPHGGIFEIPVLTVNNKNKEARNALGTQAADAVGITPKVASQLSGADFDGDTVLCIPTIKGPKGIDTKPPLEGLKDFDPSMAYPKIEGMKIMKKDNNQQKKMGEVSNLIMDMTLKGADDSDIAKATRHSMVIIDAAKHELNWEQSYKDNDIRALEIRFKGHMEDGKMSTGASTLITQAGSEVNIPKRKGQGYINEKGKPWYDPTKEEGAMVYKTAPDEELYYTNKSGKTVMRTQKVPKMSLYSDAHELSSGTVTEELYANFANKMKATANDARREYLRTPRMEYKKEMAEKYSEEVSSLKRKLNDSMKNTPKERLANTKANYEVEKRLEALKDEDPFISKNEIKKQRKKIAQSAIETWRRNLGAHRVDIDITDREWEAIQSGAIHDSTFESILKYADGEQVRKRATPKQTVEVTQSQKNMIKRLTDSGFTIDQIAQRVKLSPTTVKKYGKGE